MTRTLLSSLAVAAILAMTAGDAAPADAAEKRKKTQSGAQQSKAHPEHIDVLSWSWGSTFSPKKGLKAGSQKPAKKSGKQR